MTDAIKNLDKSGWEKHRFDEIATMVSERVDPNNTDLDIYVGLEHLDSESLHIRSHGTAADVNGTKLRFYRGDVIFGRRRAYQRKAAIAEYDGFCSAHAMVLRAKPKIIDSALFPFFIHSDQFMYRAVDISVGSLSPTINWKSLRKQEFLLPPKPEQARLAEMLWAGDGVVEGLKRVKDSNENLLKCQYKALFDFGYNSKSKKIPEGWTKKRIKSFAKVKAGSTPLRSDKSFFQNGDINWVKTLDLNNGEILESEELITQKAIDKTSCKIRPKETVLVAMYGGFNQIGRTGILKVPAATNQAISGIEINEAIILSRYLLHVLNANISYWKRVAISSRKDPNITKSDVENFPVPVPHNLNEQRTRVELIDTHLNVIRRTEANFSSTRLLQKSLINQIF